MFTSLAASTLTPLSRETDQASTITHAPTPHDIAPTFHHRGLGDLDFKEPIRLLTPEPEVTHVTLQPGTDQFVVYGSDGLW
jgi:serine/threonine protein phosphatase PrpC